MEKDFLAREIQGLMDANGIDHESGTGGPLQFEWMNLNRVLHPNGYKRLYYVTSGAKGANAPAVFQFKITNDPALSKPEKEWWRNVNYLQGWFFNVYIKVQFTRTENRTQVTWKAKNPKDPAADTIWKTISLAKWIQPGEKKIYQIEIPADMLKAARELDNNDFTARLDVEVRYSMKRPGTYNYIKPVGTAFRIVKPVEYVFGSKLEKKPDKNKEAILKDKMKVFVAGLPTNVEAEITVSNSTKQANTTGVTANFEFTQSQSSKKEASITIPVASLFEITGGASTEVSSAITRSYGTEHTFSSEIENVITTHIRLPVDTKKGKQRTVYLVPDLQAVPIQAIYSYSKINDFGQPQKIEMFNNVSYIYKILGWRFIIVYK